MLHFSSAFALIVGMFLIYNAFAIAVTQRRGEIGLLRALGATRAGVALFVGESLLLALVRIAVSASWSGMRPPAWWRAARRGCCKASTA